MGIGSRRLSRGQITLSLRSGRAARAPQALRYPAGWETRLLENAGVDTIAGAFGASAIFLLILKLMLSRLSIMVGIAVVFVPLQLLIPFHPKQRVFRPYWGLDFLHFFVGGMFILVFVRLTGAFIPSSEALAGIVGTPFNFREWPVVVQFLAWEAGWTFLGYWLHRFEHVWAPLWRLHSIHECSEDLDWLSAFRLHWFEPALFQMLTIVPMWLLGFSSPAIIGYTTYSYFTGHIQHANVWFPMGPLKYVLPSPMFHRWHHAADDVKGGHGTSNFGHYPIWDWLFGTFYLPDERPTKYGNAPHVPMDYLAQMAYPFGFHEAVLRWEQALARRFPVRERLAGVVAWLAPLHDAFERQLQRLCLWQWVGRVAPEKVPSVPA
jgi:sterol desaturase/sphingolipid hydroxylase (fatty acid hydroxylase superfamily)